MEDIRQEDQANDLDGKYLDSWNGRSFSFIDLLDVSSAYDFIAGDLMTGDLMMTDEECGEALQKNGYDMPSVKPHIAIVDLNNTKEEHYVNKPKRAIEVGVEVGF